LGGGEGIISGKEKDELCNEIVSEVSHHTGRGDLNEIVCENANWMELVYTEKLVN
jgi:hypothetical protein